jgi:biopolymer transport protein ExbD
MAYAMARRARTLAPAADPNVIPFIDVLLVLIIFMVTAPKPTTDLRVDLSGRGPPIQVEVPPTIVDIRATPSGAQIYLADEPVTRAALPARVLSQMMGADPAITAAHARAEGRVFVRADLEVAYDNVVSVVDELQHARFRGVSIVAQDADAP